MEWYEKPPPATDLSISEWESAFGVLMPSDLTTLLRQADGPILYDKHLSLELQFLSAVDAVQYYHAYQFLHYCADAIPICMDGCGNFATYKRKQHEISGIFAMSAAALDWKEAVRLCDNVSGLLALQETIESRLRG